MKKRALSVAVGIVAVAAIGSCTHEPVLPEQKISFNSQILPIIQGSCQFSGCHGAVHPERFQLATYQDLMDEHLVVALKPHESKFYTSVTTISGEDKMPRDPYPALTDKQIKMIYVWIAQGAENN